MISPLVRLDHSIETFRGKELLFVHIIESAVKPVHLFGKTIEDSFIRSGGTTRKASRQDVGALMLNSKSPTWEELHASKLLSDIEVITLLEYDKILELLGNPIPTDLKEIMRWLQDEKMVVDVDGKGYYITNFGAISSAKDLTKFDGLTRKSVRLIKYEGKNKAGASKEFPGQKGYAIGFEGLITFIQGLLNDSEVIRNSLRVNTSIYPVIALRELAANILIHQDFTIKGSGPMIEIFDDRIVFTSPGKLLPSKTIDRLIRTTPESRNEVLASAFRRYHICEERGSGFEKAVINIELLKFTTSNTLEEHENFFVVTMFFSSQICRNEVMKKGLKPVISIVSSNITENGGFNNASLRKRLGMNDKQASQVSLLIKESYRCG